MISDIRKLKIGSILKVENQNVIAFIENKRDPYAFKNYDLKIKDHVLLLDILVMDQTYTTQLMNWTKQKITNFKSRKDIYFKCLHNNTTLEIYVTSVDYKTSLPKDLKNNLFVTYNFSLVS